MVHYHVVRPVPRGPISVAVPVLLYSFCLFPAPMPPPAPAYTFTLPAQHWCCCRIPYCLSCEFLYRLYCSPYPPYNARSLPVATLSPCPACQEVHFWTRPLSLPRRCPLLPTPPSPSHPRSFSLTLPPPLSRCKLLEVLSYPMYNNLSTVQPHYMSLMKIIAALQITRTAYLMLPVRDEALNPTFGDVYRGDHSYMHMSE